MAWWTRFLRAFKRESDSDEAIAFGQNAFSVPSLTGVNINQQTALSSTAVLAAVTMLAEDVAKLPWALYRGQEDGSRVAVEDHWLSELLQQPNAWQNGFEFREQMQLALVMRGNAYAAIARSGRGVPYKLIPINPDWVSLWEAPGGDLFYRVTPTGLHLMAELRDQPFLIPSADMLHIRGFSLNGLLGSSRIMLAREAVGLAIAQEQTCVRWMGQGARPSGSFTTDQKLNEATAKRLLSELKGYFGGLQNSGKMMLLEQGLKWQSHSMTAQEAEFVAARGFQLAEVARAFRVPPHLIADLSRSTNNNIVQQSQEYVNFTITGYTRRWSEKYSSTFALRKEKLFIEFDYAVLTRADIATRYNNYRTGIMSMVLTPDEARLDDGRAPMGGDAGELQFPANMAAAGSQSTGTAPDGAGRPKDNEARGLSAADIEAIAGVVTRLMRHSEDQPRDDNGRFGSGGLSARIATSLDDVKSFIKGKSAADVIAAAASTEIAKEALSFALQSLLSHATGLDQSTWKLNEEFVQSAVHHFRDGAEITVLQAREAMRTCVRGLTALRETQLAKILMRAEAAPAEESQDLALKWLKAVGAALDNDELFKEDA